MPLLLGAASASADTFIVSNGADTGGSCPTPSTCTLRQAMSDADVNGNEPTADLIQITFTGNIDLGTALPDVTTAMTIDGPGASNLHVRRSSTASTQFGIFSFRPDTDNTVTIQDLTISGARATNTSGAGINKSGLGTLVVDSVVLSDNRIAGNGSGGGIHYDQGFTSIRNSTLTNNEADFGGAILGSENSLVGGDAEIVNSTITDNRAPSFGGGVYVGGIGHAEIVSSTIVGNTADSDDTGGGDGGGVYGGGDETQFSIANTLLAGNMVGLNNPVANQCGSPVTSFGYNLKETDDVGSACEDSFIGTGDFVDSNAALLGSLASNGGPTPTIALLSGNPAIDAGNPATLGGAFPACPAADQRGLARGGGAGRCDIGAFELNAGTGTGGGGGGASNPPPITSATGARAAAIKKCKKKFRHKPAKRKKCIKQAKKLPA